MALTLGILRASIRIGSLLTSLALMFSGVIGVSAETLSPDSTASANTAAPAVQPKVVIADLAAAPESIQRLTAAALKLHDAGLGYRFGSADPAQGGMDCSGTIHYLLRSLGWKNVPRQSDGLYRWAWEKGTFVAVNSVSFDTFEWSRLAPGDLLFWTGTYDVQKGRDPAISHVMVYLGRDEASDRRIMFGASEGRRFGGVPRSGVGLFDFELPTPGSRARFVGYAKIPSEL